jgi:hypothetical protein
MGNKVTCTCGHSWNKSDSNKKDATVCHICGKDNEMKNGGWLDKYEQGGMVLDQKINDNYGKRENANEGYSAAGPGWIGEGTTNKGFNYNGAWGGQFAMGGTIPGAVGFTYARTKGIPSEGPYAKKTLPSAQNGKEMQYYQEGLDWQPKMISKNGGDIINAQDGRTMRAANAEFSCEAFPRGKDKSATVTNGSATGFSNAPITWNELVKYNETNPKDKVFKNRLKDLQSQFPGLTSEQLLAAQGDSARIKQRMSNLPRYDKPAEQTYDKAYHQFYRTMMDQLTPVTTPQILQFHSQKPGGLPGYQQTVQSNYGRPKAENGGWLDAYDVPEAQVGRVTPPVFKGFTPQMLTSAQRSADLSKRTTGYASQDKAMLTETEMRAKKAQQAINDAAEIQRRKDAIAKSNNSKGFIEEAQNAAAGEKFRFFPNDPESTFDEYFNPLKMVGDMADNLGRAFTDENATLKDKALAIAGPLVAGGLAGIGTNTAGQFVNNLTNPFAGIVNAKKIKNYQEGFKRVLPEKQYLTGEFSGNKFKELKKLALSLSPNTTQALGKLDANIAKEMLNDYRFGEYSTIKDFRRTVKKALLESERLKKINPNVDFSRDLGIQSWMLKKPENLKNFADAQLMMDKSLSSQKKFLNYIEDEYNKKINLINNHDVFKNIAEESPQYTDLIYDHLKNPQVPDNIFLDNLVKQSNTFTRAVKNPLNNKNEFFNISGRSITKSGKNTMDVEGFPVSNIYGDYRYKIEPDAEKMAEIASAPLEEKWSKRFLDNSNISNDNINLEDGWLTQKSEDYSNWFKKRRQRNNQVKNVPMIVDQPMNIPQKYLNYPQHKIFTSDLNEQVLKGFDLSELNISNKDAYKYLPGFTRGFKKGGVIQDDRGQWAHPGEITRISGGNITMKRDPRTGKALTQPILGIADTGEEQMMYPGQDYEFEGAEYVTEYPKGKRPKKAKNGVNQADENSLVQLDQLTNFTNYNTKQPGGWLDNL